jgi:16S rRNA (guanine966-N2)-methyltransferase
MPLRVISGSAGGLHLRSPKRHPLRPTQDRIRQVIFSSLAEHIPGARVLDLFAGTGSFGIEALSRGAASATFVENNAEAVACIRANLETCRLQGVVLSTDVFTALASPSFGTFDLIFADPPYVKERTPLDGEAILSAVKGHLSTDGFFVLEHFAGRELSASEDWEVTRKKDYGETGLTFLRHLREK